LTISYKDKWEIKDDCFKRRDKGFLILPGAPRTATLAAFEEAEVEKERWASEAIWRVANMA